MRAAEDTASGEHRRVDFHTLPARPRAAVLLLHGGRADALEPPTRWNLPGLRMRPFARALARATAEEQVAVAHARYRYRGWNGVRADAAADAEAALAALVEEVGKVPVVLVGHSMGGRAALRIGGAAGVRGVVALAPWCPPGEPVAQLAGQRAVLLHGDRDRMTDPRGTWSFAARARAAGARTCAVVVTGSDHPMIRRAETWHRSTVRLVRGMLWEEEMPAAVAAALDGPPDGPGGRRPIPLAEALPG